MKASHQQHSIFIGNQLVELQPGQFVFGRKASAKETGLSQQETRTCVKLLENIQNLTIKTTNKFSIITIVNWDTYQNGKEISTSKSTSNQPTDNQQITTNNNVNNGKNVKNKNIYPDDFESFWKAYPNKSGGKADAFKSWKKVEPLRPSLDDILKAVGYQARSEQWKKDDGQYIPQATRWLNSSRWDAVMEIKPKSNAYDPKKHVTIFDENMNYVGPPEERHKYVIEQA